MGIRPVLPALRTAQGMPAYWYCGEGRTASGGSKIVELMRDMDKKADSVTPTGGNKLSHQLKTFDFVAMCIPVTCLNRVMEELMELACYV